MNIIIAVFAGDEAVVQSMVESNQIFVPSVALGELYYGAFHSLHVEANVARVLEFAGANAVLSCDGETARQCGELKHTFRVKGQPLPENDIWIAASARQHRLPLVSRDEHFREFEEVQLLTW